MSRQIGLSSPFMLGFDEIERALDRVAKAAGDGYPPYNIERISASTEGPEKLRITLAVAGFAREDIEILVEDRQLLIRGRQHDDKSRAFLHRGIAARQFQRAFLLADGLEVQNAELAHGLLSIDLTRPATERVSRRIVIDERE
ncbi:MAG: Hsp20 family protein [Hyphomicrobiales bacterium]|nr:Hsp20 family protein [Hyphomicrobiales bacterium]